MTKIMWSILSCFLIQHEQGAYMNLLENHYPAAEVYFSVLDF